jgi:3-deoxy-D-manno-octulosonic-acid transferase
MIWFYNALWLLALPGVTCYLAFRRILSGKYRYNLGLRLGFGLSNQVQPSNREVIWVHALSVGEVLSAVPLVHSLRDKLPQYDVVFSTTTESGQQIARRLLSPSVSTCIYLPLDYYWAIRRAVKAAGAKLFVLVETDFWPNLFWCLEKQNTPIVLVNGRLSDRSFERYKRLRSFFGQAFRRINVFCMQSQEDAQRMGMLGIEDEKIKVTGNLKFDQPLVREVHEEREELYEELGWNPPGLTWIAGSTHPGEEEIILRVYSRLRQRFHELSLVLAPRNPERFTEVYRRAGEDSWQTVLRSKLQKGGRNAIPIDVLILDTIGELARFYSLGDFAYVGGSLVSFGGHNPLEAAQRGVPVVFGPFMENFREIARILQESGGGFQVDNENELFGRIESWLSTPTVCREQGDKARAALRSHQGAVARNVEVIKSLLGCEPAGQ